MDTPQHLASGSVEHRDEGLDRRGRFGHRIAFVGAGAATGLFIGSLITLSLLHPEFSLFGGLGGACWGALVGLDAPRSVLQVVVKTVLTSSLAGPVLGGVLAALVFLVAGVGP
jgi:hypothetical protein